MYVSRCLSRRAISAGLTVTAAIAIAGCGGGSGGDSATRVVRGPGFTFEAPSERELARAPRSITVLAADADSPELVSVTQIPLGKVFRPSLWAGARLELDGLADRLAASLGGEYAQAPQTVRQAGLRGRRYEIAYEREGEELVQRLTLLLDRKTEYQLLCRWAAIDGEPPACGLLERSFGLAPC